MPNLLDQAIKVGQELEQADQKLQTAKQQLEEVETAVAARRQELAVLERDSAQQIQSERSTWDAERRHQVEELAKRLADVEAREHALKALPDQLTQLAEDQKAVEKRAADASAQWQKAKDAETHWVERNKELDAKAEAINQLAAKTGVEV